MLDTDQLKVFDQRLTDRAAQLAMEIESVGQRRLREPVSDVIDMKDVAGVEAAAVVGGAEVDRDIAEWSEIGAARRRIQDGSYGMCLDCGDEIQLDRLVAEPQAARCLPCQTRVEQLDRPRSRRR